MIAIIMIINQFDHDHCNDHEYRDDGESGGKRTYCQEGGGDGQGAGSKNLKKEKLEQIYSCDDRMGNMYFGSF